MTRRALHRAAAVIGLTVSLALVASLPAHADTRARSNKRFKSTKSRVEGGNHWRLSTPKGAIHIWIPPGYDRRTAGVVVYLHGDGPDVDGVWRDHNLPKQFRASKQNAMFIVPEAPSNKDEAVHWPSLGGLRSAISRRGGFRLPNGPLVVVGHSRAFTTIANWVDNRRLGQVILLDGLFANQEQFREFILTGKRALQHRLVMVANHTLAEMRSLARSVPGSVFRKNVPKTYAEFSRREKRARVFVIESQYGHMEMVTGGNVIPLVLRLSRLRALR